jgi:hypothetical protein
LPPNIINFLDFCFNRSKTNVYNGKKKEPLKNFKTYWQRKVPNMSLDPVPLKILNKFLLLRERFFSRPKSKCDT